MKGFSYSMTNFRNHNTECKVVPRPDQTKVILEDENKVNQHGMLNRVVMNHLKKKKKKKGSKPLMTFRQQFVNGVEHFKSLEKMQSVNSQRNEDIKRHIQQKASMYRQNEQLRQMLMNPSLKENELHSKIYLLETQVNTLKALLDEKDTKHQQQIAKMNQRHRQEIEAKDSLLTGRQKTNNYHQSDYIKQHSPRITSASNEKQAKNIRAVNFVPSSSISASNQATSYSPPKNIIYQSYENNPDSTKYEQNQLYNPKVVKIDNLKSDGQSKRNNMSPPNTSSVQNTLVTNYQNYNKQQINRLASDNRYENNNVKIISQQPAIINKGQIKTTIVEVSSNQISHQSSALGKPVYIASRNQQATAYNSSSSNNYQASGANNQTSNFYKSEASTQNYSQKNSFNQVSNPNKYHQVQRQKLNINVVQSNAPKSQTTVNFANNLYNSTISSMPVKSSYGTTQAQQYKGYGEMDLQEIYKKYCID